jgi:hypothetical protein
LRNNARRRALIAGVGAQLAGVIWLLQWSHALVTHGPTQANRAQLWLGMTWFDSGKFLALSFLLLIPGVLLVRGRAEGRRSCRVLGAVLVGTLVLTGVGTALEFGLYEWGSYREPESAVAAVAGPLTALARGVALPLAWLSFGASAVRADVLPPWLVALLVIGSLATYFVAGPLPPIPGLVWLLFGGWLLSSAPASAPQSHVN